MAETFQLPEGIAIDDVSGLKSAYTDNGDGNISAVVSAEKLCGLIAELTALLPEPAFFFIELPCDAEEEKKLGGGKPHYKLYYLDNCTKNVISALVSEYGDMLVNDGLVRFGFGGNESGDELYVQRYKVMSIYSPDKARLSQAEKLLRKLGAGKQDELLTPWDIISPENTAVCASVEEDGISVFDLPEMLAKAGMYRAKET
jgi:hypothetical protein